MKERLGDNSALWKSASADSAVRFFYAKRWTGPRGRVRPDNTRQAEGIADQCRVVEERAFKIWTSKTNFRRDWRHYGLKKGTHN